MKNIDKISYSEKFEYADSQDEYQFQLRKRSYRWLWWLLLPLLLLLLLVRCEREITVATVDAATGDEVVCDSVTLSYTAHYLLKDWAFLADEPYVATVVPDSAGVAVFSGLPCSVFSYIFYAFSEAEITVASHCYMIETPPARFNFHYTRYKEVEMTARTGEVVLTVVDRETGDPLAGARVDYRYAVSGKEVADSVVTDGAGKCSIAGAPVCGSLDVTRAGCYAYKDTTGIEIFIPDLAENDSLSVIPLTPVKESFVFFVKDKYTLQPIPEASVVVTLRDRSSVIRQGPATTNVDGKGRGSFADAFIGATLELQASKTGYRDSVYTPVCTVDEFNRKPDDQRVIYLEPLPHTESFINVDSISRRPIAGVSNHIVVNSVSGSRSEYDEVSNRNGVFTVAAIAGDHIEIYSDCKPRYEAKHTEIASFSKGDTIPMRPILVTLDFKTVKAYNDEILPGCTLKITTSASGINKPVSSGSGEFSVSGLFPDETISIVSSKKGFKTNDYTIRNASVSSLMSGPADDREIPMEGECTGSAEGKSDVKAGTMSAPMSFCMGRDSGSFVFEWDTSNACPDQIFVYNHPSERTHTSSDLIFNTEMETSDGWKKQRISFNKGDMITVVVKTGPKDGSAWDIKVNCPD